MENQDNLLFLSSSFIIPLATLNIIATKLIKLRGVTLPAGTIAYFLTFVLTYAIAKVWQKKTARIIGE